jgi:glutathione S-transferase
MTEHKVQLITFGSSHYCEKARWALDWHHISYREIGWPPGLHRVLAKRCGVAASSLPILLDGETAIQGSDVIIDWADSKANDNDSVRRLAPSGDSAEAKEIETRANEVVGVHVRRLAYAEMLPKYPKLAKPGLFLRASGWHRLIGNMMWPVSRRIMMRGLDIRPGAAAESRSKLESELDWLDCKLADGRAYLAGDRFSRVDLTVASLLAGFARPAEMLAYRDMAASDALTADVERWKARPIMRWVVAQYQCHRAPRSEGADLAAA